MPTITSDGQSLSIDGRRLWLVSGVVHYARIPRGLWSARLSAARDAGFNCIEVPVPWARHEPRSGVFDFKDENDLPEFIRMIGALGMHCIVRAGPYIGDGYDLGGLPSWLMPISGDRLRSGAPEYLQACSRYISALCAQLKDLQASNPRKRTGPIVMLLSEYQWYCDDAAAGDAYLGELDRFFRENGISVPIVGAHNLFHSVEGQINAWTGRNSLHSNMRQLRTALPEQPPIVAGLSVGAPALWGTPAVEESPAAVARRAAETLAAGAQFSISPLCAGTSFGFGAGRIATRDVMGYLATEAHSGAPIDGAGGRTSALSGLRRVCTFASHFGRVLANLDGAYQPVVASLDGAGGQGQAAPGGARKRDAKPQATGSPAGPVCLESRGSQGSIVWLFDSNLAGGRSAPTRLTLGDGSTLSMYAGEQSVAWALFDVHLFDRATLDFCNLCVFALVGSVLVCFGPAGALGALSINGSGFELNAPTGAEPLVERHEGVTIVVCNEQSIDATVVSADAVYVGASGLDAEGQPLPRPDYGRITRIAADGEKSTLAGAGRQKGAARASAQGPAFSAWHASTTDEYVEGTSDRFALIDGPKEMQALGAPAGYGWIRLKLRSSAAKSVQAGFFESADRLHLFGEGAARGIVGWGPGALGSIAPVQLRKGEQVLTMLVDNLGRGLESGVRAERKGLYGHIHRVSPFKAGAAKLVAEAPLGLLAAFSPLMGVEKNDQTDAARLTWTFQHRKKSPLFVTIDAVPARGLLLLNDQPIAALEPGVEARIVLRDDRLTRGGNKLQVALNADMQGAQRDLKAAVKIFEGVESLTEKAEWAFARWEPPAKSRFSAVAGAPESALSGRPCWWRGQFAVTHTDAPLFLDAEGLSKGVLSLNGRELGRYWVSAPKGKSNLPPQNMYYLPEPWLRVDGPNELLIFDEHGRAPAKARLVYRAD